MDHRLPLLVHEYGSTVDLAWNIDSFAPDDRSDDVTQQTRDVEAMLFYNIAAKLRVYWGFITANARHSPIV